MQLVRYTGFFNNFQLNVVLRREILHTDDSFVVF